MSVKDDLNTPLISLVAFVFTVVCFVIIVFLIATYHTMQNAENQVKLVDPKPEELRTLVAQENKKLHGYALIDSASAQVTIPIDRAMEVLVQEYAAGSPKYQQEQQAQNVQ